MDFEIILVGLNHRGAGVDIREKFSLADHCGPENWAFANVQGLRESLILSTCNRVEVLAIGLPAMHENILQAWARLAGSDARELEQYLYAHSNLEAVRHIFEVASSLDSMVLGEPQILGQFKEAYRKAVKSKQSGPIINRLLHKAFYVAKRVRNETAIAANAVSVSYAAVELAKSIFGQFNRQSALLIGAGEMAELAAMHLLRGGIKKLFVANRTLAHGLELCKKFNASSINFEEIAASLGDMDIVIASTGSKEPIINKKDVASILKRRKNHPMFFIDIAVPRDIDPAVNSLDNVYLYDIDDLKEVVEDNRQARQQEAIHAKEIINEETLFFAEWLKNLSLQPTILDLLSKADMAGKIEVERTLKKLGGGTPELRQALEIMAKALTRRMNHAPLTWLKHRGMGQIADVDRAVLIRKIFDLDNLTSVSPGHK